MTGVRRHPRVVQSAPRDDVAPGEDLTLALVFLAIGLIPLVGEVAGLGQWGHGTVGLGTLAVLFGARQLWSLISGRMRGHD